MNCLVIVGPSITGRRESEVEIRIRTYSDSITSIHRGAGRIEDYTNLNLHTERGSNRIGDLQKVDPTKEGLDLCMTRKNLNLNRLLILIKKRKFCILKINVQKRGSPL